MLKMQLSKNGKAVGHAFPNIYRMTALIFEAHIYVHIIFI